MPLSSTKETNGDGLYLQQRISMAWNAEDGLRHSALEEEDMPLSDTMTMDQKSPMDHLPNIPDLDSLPPQPPHHHPYHHHHVPYHPLDIILQKTISVEFKITSSNGSFVSFNASNFRTNVSMLTPITYYSYDEASDDPTYLSIRHFQKCVIPILCLLGFAGNLSSVGIFRDATMKTKSCCLYLVTKCITDTLFLSALFLVWLDRIDVDWFHKHGVCQMIVFVTYVCGFISVWMVVMVTLENYVRVCHPHQVHIWCTPGKAKGVLMLLGLMATFCYNFPLWTTYSDTTQNKSICSLNPGFSNFNEGLTYFDTAMTLVIPAVLVFAFMCAIFVSLLAVYKRNKRMKKLGRQRHIHFFCLSPYGRVTAMLLAVSITFIALHTPSHAIRIRLLFAQFVERRPALYLYEFRLQRMFELLYYSNFATNCVTYLTFGKAFRDLYRFKYCFCCCKEQKLTIQLHDGGYIHYVSEVPYREDALGGTITETELASFEVIMLKASTKA